MGSDERAIREIHSAWIDAVNAGDLSHLLALITDDVVFLQVDPKDRCTNESQGPSEVMTANVSLAVAARNSSLVASFGQGLSGQRC